MAEFNITKDGITFDIGTVSIGSFDPYTGSTTVTPSDETQTLATAGKALESNITINPVPSSYGKITYDGTSITVS